MTQKNLLLIATVTFIFLFSSCSENIDQEAISGSRPLIVEVAPVPITSEEVFLYESELSLAESFKQMNSLRISIRDDMYSAVAHLNSDFAWVPKSVNNYIIGCDEFLPASYVMETEPNVTTEKLLSESGFKNIETSPLDVENTWKITATKDENNMSNNYEYTVNYDKKSDSYRFALTINNEPNFMLASRRITDGYAVQFWVPEGIYNILVQDNREGSFGYIPKSIDADIEFPENDVYFDEALITSSFVTKSAEYILSLENNYVFFQRDGSRYRIALA